MFYPALAPALFGIHNTEQDVAVDEEIDPKQPTEKAPPKEIAKVEPKKPVVVEKPAESKKEPEPMKGDANIAEVPKEEKPEEPITPDLNSNETERIIIDAVETGKWIDFRKDNIIEWKLLEQSFSKLDNEYQGEVSVEIGNLFGKSNRKAKVTIVDKKVIQWIWIETE